MAWGVVIGGACQLFGQMPSMVRKGFSFRPAIDWSHPGLRQIVRLMGPAVLGGAAVQINVFVNTNLATGIIDPVRGADGAVSWLQYAFRFFQLPLGLFGVALASATTPAISRSFASGNHEEFRRTLSRSLGVVLLMTVPSSIGLVVLGGDMISAVFEHGEFDSYDARQTALALSYYAIGLVSYSGAKLLTTAFYTLKDSRTPMLVSLGSIAINFVVATGLVRLTGLGHAGLALSTSAVATFSFLCLFAILRARIGGIYGRGLAGSALHMAVAGAAMGRWSSLVNLAVCVPAGLGVFYAVCRLLRVAELDLAVAGMMGPFQRWIPGFRARV